MGTSKELNERANERTSEQCSTLNARRTVLMAKLVMGAERLRLKSFERYNVQCTVNQTGDALQQSSKTSLTAFNVSMSTMTCELRLLLRLPLSVFNALFLSSLSLRSPSGRRVLDKQLHCACARVVPVGSQSHLTLVGLSVFAFN